MKKLIIIPAYNESECIENTVKDIITNAGDFDYVVINDCSTDNTGEICEKKGFNHINLPVNLGIGGAVQTGYRYAFENGYDVAVQVDGDGQHDVAFLYKMFEKMEENKYLVKEDGFLQGMYINSGFTVKIETIDSELLAEAKQYLDNQIKRDFGWVYFHLSKGFLTRYTVEELK